mmetsp:Transcript_116110/g.205625  ORF Transcript_116110/g.205625 Transcript_116110/m.205625 type:complete len:423 (+) Transcript_116110:70-1338(+)
MRIKCGCFPNLRSRGPRDGMQEKESAMLSDTSVQGKRIPPSENFRRQVEPWRSFSVQRQLEALDEFRSALALEDDGPPDDLTCLRFLRARGLKMESSLKMWRTYCSWRMSSRVDDIFTEEEAILNNAAVGDALGNFTHGLDFLGRPVHFIDAGRLDMRACKRSGITKHMLVTRHTQEMELLWRSLALRDETTEAFRRSWRGKQPALYASDPLMGNLSIVDCGKCTIGGFWPSLDVWLAKAKIDQDYFPEMLGNAVIVNPVYGFYSAWNLVRTFLDEHTVAKIEIVSGDPRERLSKLIPQEGLPEKYKLRNPNYVVADDLIVTREKDLQANGSNGSGQSDTLSGSRWNLLSTMACCTARDSESDRVDSVPEDMNAVSAASVETDRSAAAGINLSDSKQGDHESSSWLQRMLQLCKCRKRKHQV